MSDHILLIIVIAVLILGAVKGYRKGFLRLAVWFAALVAALFVVTRIAPHVSSFLIENTTLKEKIEEKIVEAYENKNASRLPDSTLPGDEGQNTAIDSLGLPALIADTLKSNNTSEIYNRLAVSLFREYIAGYLSTLSVKAGTFVGLLILLFLIEFILIMTIKLLEKIPVLRTFNRLLGMAAGITLSLVFIWIFFLAVMMFFGHSFGGWVFAQVGNSRFLTYLFNNNILFGLL